MPVGSANSVRVWWLSVIAVAPVLSIVHHRMAERGGRNADLSRKYPSCLPVLLSCYRAIVQDEGAANNDGLAKLEPEPSADSNGLDADVLQLHAASALTALVDFVKEAAVHANAVGLQFEQQTAGAVGGSSVELSASDDEVHLVRYLLVRFCLGLLGTNVHLQSTCRAHTLDANPKVLFVVAGAQGEGTCEAAASPVAQLILSATTACQLSISDLLHDFGTYENDHDCSNGVQNDAGVRGRAMIRLRGLELGGSSEWVEWAHQGWTETETWRGLLAYACFAMPSPADADLDTEPACRPLAAAQPLLLSATGRLWLEGPLLAHILRQPAVGVDRPWVLRALQRLGLAVSVLHGCEATLDVAESAGRACLLLGIGQALLQFMAQTPEDAVRRQQIPPCRGHAQMQPRLMVV
eukprot:COSAG02_NODE_1829_length_10738_cov_4.595827_6_plen_409_part_00